MTVTLVWRLGLAAALVVAVMTSACARAPRRSTPAGELWRLVVCALVLYAVGALAALAHHAAMAGVVYGFGIGVAALAAWLSRGRDQEDPPGGGRGGSAPVDGPPSPEPDGEPPLDWARFEREFRRYAERRPVGSGRTGR